MGDDKVEGGGEAAVDGFTQWATQNAPEVAEAADTAAPPVVEEAPVEIIVEEDAPVAAHKAPAHKAPAHREHAAPPKQRTYTVKSGDTLSAIGQHFGVSWQKIAKVNNIENPDLIFPGQTFVIPD